MRLLFGLLLLMLSIPVFAQDTDDRYYYVVQPNDTASDILYRAAIKPLYPRYKKSTLQTLIEENKGLLQDVSRIYPGQKIYFSKKTIEKALAQNLVEIKSKKEIIFTATNTVEPLEAAPVVVAPAAEFQKTETVVETSALPSIDEATDKVSEASLQELPEGKVYFYFGSGYSKVESSYSTNAATVSLLSDRLLHLKVGLHQPIDEKWEAYAEFDLLSVPYRDSFQNRVNSRSQNLTTFSFGGVLSLPTSWSFKFGGGVSENIFAPSFQSGTVSVNKRSLLFLEGAAVKKLLERKGLKLNGDVGANWYLSDSSAGYSIDSGLAYKLGLEMIRSLSAKDWHARFEYIEKHFKTSVTDQDEKLFLATLGITFPAGGWL